MAGVPEKSDLLRIAEIFDRHKVEFLVIGGQAETLMGSPRVTYDVDLCYRRSKENLERLSHGLLDLDVHLRDVPADLPFILDARTLAAGSNFTLTSSVIDLDLLGWVEPIGDYEALARDVEVYALGSIIVRSISLENLLKVKQHINRAKDGESIFQLLAIKAVRNQTKPPNS